MKVIVCLVAVLVALTMNLGCDSTSPKARTRRIESLLSKAEEDASQLLKEGGLPPPPRHLDMMTGGDIGAGLDLKQAMQNGDPRSAQRIYSTSVAALRGIVVHYSKCLDEPAPKNVVSGGDILLPPGAEEEELRLRAAMDFQKHKALVKVRDLYLEAFTTVSELGPVVGDPKNNPGNPQSAAKETNLTSKQLEVEGLGHVWVYKFMRPVGKNYAMSPDGTVWMRIEGRQVVGIREGKIHYDFEGPDDVQMERLEANEKGLVVFGTSTLNPSTRVPGTALVQFDRTGKVLWRKDFEWDSKKVAGSALLSSLDTGEVFIDIRLITRDSQGALSYRSQVTRLDGNGMATSIPVPDSMRNLEAFYKMDGQVFALDRNYNLHKIANDRFEFVVKGAYPNHDGRWLQPGDDGHWYLYDEQFDKKRFKVKRLGDKPSQSTDYTVSGTTAGSGYHIAQDGRLFALGSQGLVCRKPGSDSNLLDIPFSPEFPTCTRLISLGKGRFLMDYDQSDLASQFMVIDVK